MRVALVCDEFYPDLGGIAHYGYELALQYAARDLDFTVVTHTHSGQPDEERVDDIPIKRIPGRVLERANRIVSMSTFHRCHRYLSDQRFDVIHGLTMYSPMAFMAVDYARRNGVASVFTCHSIIEPTYQVLLHLPLMPFIRGANRIIAVSNATAAFCRRLTLPAERIVTIPNGVDMETFNVGVDGAAFRSRLQLDSQPVVVTAIRLAKRKRPDLLLSAFAAVLKSAPDTHLIIAGAGAEEKRLQQLIRHYGLDRNVHMVGSISKGQVAELMAAGDVFVLPSSLEAFGLAALEAAATGTAVVCSNAGGIPEVFQHGVNALLYAPGDSADMAAAIVQLIQDAGIRGELGARGQEVARQLTWEACADRTLAVYEEALRENESRRVHR